MDIKSLLKMKNADFSKITEAFDKIENPKSTTKSYVDDRFWTLEPDKIGNGSATIRFLPCVGKGEQWVTLHTHNFQGPTGKWYIENCRTTLEGEADPCVDWNNALVKTVGYEAAKAQVSAQKRKTKYICNILVINDPKHPENNGKVFLFKFGPMISKILSKKLKPAFEDIEPVNIFDLWNGADFKFRMRKLDGHANYNESEFLSCSPIAGTDEEILEIVNKCYDLSEFVDPKHFKSYDELKVKLDIVMGGVAAKSAAEHMTTQPSSKQPSVGRTQSVVDDDDVDIEKYFNEIVDRE